MKVRPSAHKTKVNDPPSLTFETAQRKNLIATPNLSAIADALTLVAPKAKPKQNAAEANQSALPDTGLVYAPKSGAVGGFAEAAITRTLDAMQLSAKRAAKAEGGVAEPRSRMLLELAERVYEVHGPIAEGVDPNLEGKSKAVVGQRQSIARALLGEVAQQLYTTLPIAQLIDLAPSLASEILDPKSDADQKVLSEQFERAEAKQAVLADVDYIGAVREDYGLKLTAGEHKILKTALQNLEADPTSAKAAIQDIVAKAEEFEANPPKASQTLSKAELAALKKQSKTPSLTPKQKYNQGLKRMAALRETVADAPEPTTQKRYEGAMIGLAIGDALGGPTEFMDKKEIYQAHGLVTDMIGGGWLDLEPGEYTDDTQMAERMATSIINQDGFDANDLGAHFVKWLNTDPKDVGNLTRQALELKRSGVDPESSGMIPWVLSGFENAGNGSVMRAAPIALLTAFSDQQTIESRAMASSAVSHADPRCTYGTAALSLAVSLIMKGEPNVLDKVVAYLKTRSPELADALAAVPDMELEDVRTSGYVVDTLQAAFWAHEHAEDYVQGIIQVTNLGEDTDTAGATAGILLGAKFGLEGIPKEWRGKLQKRDKLAKQARQIHDLATGA